MAKISADDLAELLVQLLGRIAALDHLALSALYEIASPQLFAVSMRLVKQRELAEEVVQEAFINIWRSASEYECTISTPMTWMSAIVKNRTFDYLRQQKRQTGRETEWSETLDAELANETPGPYESMVLIQRSRYLAACMSRLGANQRRALELAYLRDLSHLEVAQEMNVPLGTVKSWIRRGVEALAIMHGSSIVPHLKEALKRS